MSIVSIKHFKALEDLYAGGDKGVDALASYHILKDFLLEERDMKKVTSKVPLILQGVTREGHYEYKQREVK